MGIESLSVRNYKALKDVTLTDIPPFAVFVGANGSGKTTLFDLFGFLQDCLNGNVRTALQERGGFQEVVTRGCEAETICIELQFRTLITDVKRLVTYRLEIELRDGRPVVKLEFLRYEQGPKEPLCLLMEFSYGKGFAVTNEEDCDAKNKELIQQKWTLASPDILAFKGLSQFSKFKAAGAFRALIEGWHVSYFLFNAARGRKDPGYAEQLSVSGDNLPLVAQFIYENHRDVFERVLELMKRRVPGVQEIEAIQTEDNKIVLRFRDAAFEKPFIDRYVSDGTIKMFAYLLLLNDPSPHPLLCIEEPENQLYPSLMNELAEEFREYCEKGGQVFVSTHSPEFLNEVPIESVFWLEKSRGVTRIHRALDSQLLVDLIEAGDKPGYLWNQRFFEGADPE